MLIKNEIIFCSKLKRQNQAIEREKVELLLRRVGLCRTNHCCCCCKTRRCVADQVHWRVIDTGSGAWTCVCACAWRDVTMTSSPPLDLCNHNHDTHQSQPQPQPQQQMLNGQSPARDKAAVASSRRSRRGRRRSRPPDVVPPSWTDPPATFTDHYQSPVFPRPDGNVTEAGEDRNKPSSWPMDDNSPVTLAAIGSGQTVSRYGRRGKTGQLIH